MNIWWIRSDPCGIFSAGCSEYSFGDIATSRRIITSRTGFTVFLVLYAQFVIVRILLLPWKGTFWMTVLLFP